MVWSWSIAESFGVGKLPRLPVSELLELAGCMASSYTVKASYSCRIGLASNLAASASTGWTHRLPLPHKATISEVLSEQFLKTKPIKPVIEVSQHMTVDIGILLASDDWLKTSYRSVEFYWPHPSTRFLWIQVRGGYGGGLRNGCSSSALHRNSSSAFGTSTNPFPEVIF